MTLVLLPGLDGTEVFFRPLLAALPEWVRPIIVAFPSNGSNDYAGLLAIVSEAVAGIDSSGCSNGRSRGRSRSCSPTDTHNVFAV
jgi:hypothetical protein